MCMHAQRRAHEVDKQKQLIDKFVNGVTNSLANNNNKRPIQWVLLLLLVTEYPSQSVIQFHYTREFTSGIFQTEYKYES